MTRQTIGRGAFGKVVVAEHKRTHKLYAMKILAKPHILEMDAVTAAAVERDVCVLARGCPFLIQLIATFANETHLFILTELYSGGGACIRMYICNNA